MKKKEKKGGLIFRFWYIRFFCFTTVISDILDTILRDRDWPFFASLISAILLSTLELYLIIKRSKDYYHPKKIAVKETSSPSAEIIELSAEELEEIAEKRRKAAEATALLINRAKNTAQKLGNEEEEKAA